MSVHRERIVEEALRGVEPGWPVFTADGHPAGEVKEVRGDHVKVNAALTRDYWINGDYVFVGEGRLDLSCNKKDLNAYKLTEPETADTGSATSSGQATDAIISPEEQHEQRVRMEAELASQRRDLPHRHFDGEQSPPDTGGTLGEPVESELARIAPDVAAELETDAQADERPYQLPSPTYAYEDAPAPRWLDDGAEGSQAQRRPSALRTALVLALLGAGVVGVTLAMRRRRKQSTTLRDRAEELRRTVRLPSRPF